MICLLLVIGKGEEVGSGVDPSWGSVSTGVTAPTAGDGAAIGFAATDCQPCPLRIHCTKGIEGR